MNDYSQEKRDKSRRASDLTDLGEIRLLRHELKTIRDKLAELRADLDNEEAQDHLRITELEKQVNEFERKFNFGKGIFYGGLFVLGSTGVYLVDHMKILIKELVK